MKQVVAIPDLVAFSADQIGVLPDALLMPAGSGRDGALRDTTLLRR